MREEAERGFEIGLLDKAVYLVPLAQRIAPADIAIAGFGRRCGYSEGDEPVLAGQLAGSLRRILESLRVHDVMIARADQHHVVFVQRQRGQSNRRCGVAAHGFDHELRVGGDLRRLRLGEFEVLFSDHHHGRSEPVAVRAASERRLIKRLLTQQGNEGLGFGCPAARPETGSTSSTEYDWNDLGHLALHLAVCSPCQMYSGNQGCSEPDL